MFFVLSRLEKLVFGVVVFVEGVDDVCFSEEYMIFNRKVNVFVLEVVVIMVSLFELGVRLGLVFSCWF